MLVSGVMILLLLRVPDALKSQENIMYLLYSDATWIAFAMLFMTKAAAWLLIVNLIAHLVARCFWVGLVGINSVYPEGAKPETAGGGAVYKEFFAKNFDTLDVLATKVDRFSRLLFGLTFTLLTLMLIVIVTIFVVFLLALVVQKFLFPKTPSPIIFGGIYAFFFAPTLAIYFIDWLSERLKFLAPLSANASWKKMATAVYHFSHTFNLGRFYSPVFGTLYSHAHKGVLNFIFIGYYIAFMYLFISSDVIVYHNYLYFPKITKQYDVRYYHYENHLPTGEYNFTPTIQSDIINDKYIRLFIPHRPIDDDSLAAKFPGLAPFRVGGLGFESSKPESLDDVAKSLGALKEFYLVTLNDSALVGASYSFYTHPKSTMRGLMIYIPVDGLPKGRHLLIVRQPFTRFKRDYFIPFYI